MTKDTRCWAWSWRTRPADSTLSRYEIEPKVSKNASGKLTIYESGNTQVWCGDLFDLDAEDLKDVTAIYDRASVIALPPDMREQFASHLGALITKPQGLLLSLEYDQSKVSGPPHSVPDAEVQKLFGSHWKLTLLEEIPKPGMFKGKLENPPAELVYKLN
ncbi:putative thiopurine S-methyltransferase [Yarrowia sp. C11]|nr:putative thiopurine S-methyltransferase [Yarrowia sp. C11]